MPNTNTRTVMQKGPGRAIIYLTVDSDGSEETDLVVYDSSADNVITDPLDSTIEEVYYFSSSLTAINKLEWDASTDVLALALSPNSDYVDFRKMGGLPNTAGSGITGDITLTTTNMAAGDSLTLILKVRTN